MVLLRGQTQGLQNSGKLWQQMRAACPLTETSKESLTQGVSSASEAGPLSPVQAKASGLQDVFEQQHLFVMLLFQADAYQR